VRLAQRVPVRIRIDRVPDGVHLVAGMTATVQIDAPIERTAWSTLSASFRALHKVQM
jgi:multidrug resistance efflux pump